jgi:glycosyltransferase involved in cell wall biosynthesis
LIVTRNRKDEVIRAIRSAVEQEGSPEILVLDDGSTDGTPEAIEREFPEVRLVAFDRSEEVVVRRNRGFELASSPIVVAIDDDSEFSSPAVVAQTVADFDDPRVGAVAVPCIDLVRDETVRQRAPADDGVFVTQQFFGAACALRREAFLEVGGYRPVLEHQAEEPDLCVRLLDAGYVVRLGRSDPITHYGSPKRDVELMWFRGCRNDILFAWLNVPLPDVLVHAAKQTLYELWLGRGVGRVGLFARGVLAGYREGFRCRRERVPVRRDAYRLYQRLARPTRLDEIASALVSAPAHAAASESKTGTSATSG